MPEIILLAIIVIVTFLYLFEKAKSNQPAEQKGLDIIHSAIKKAQTIVGSAELEEIKIIAQSNLQTKQLEETLTANLEANFKEYLAQLEKKSADMDAALLESTKQRVNLMLDHLEQSLSQFLSQTSQKSTTSIELEIRGARQLIESYKSQQLALIDENILSMLERTLSLILSKKLKLNDQLDLVYEALEKAKIEKFVV